MGTFRVTLEISDPLGQRYETIEALVDTGATYTWVPRSVLERLQVAPKFRRPFLTADGRQIEREMATILVRIDEREHPTPCIFGDEGTEPLLGVVTLEELGLGVDPVNRRLIPVPGLLMATKEKEKEEMMPVRLISALGLVSLLVFSACVTINIYFPAKEVKAAYKSLEEELLKPGPEPSPPPKSKPEGRLEPDERSPLSLALPFQGGRGGWRIVIPEAWAQGDLSRQINEEVKKMPEVVEAYRRMGQRLREIDRLRSQGIVGEGRDGKLILRVDRSQVSPGDLPLIDQENQDREIVILGMTKAVLRVTGQMASPATLNQARSQAAELFAHLRQETAKPGWWIQLPDGTWRKK